MFIFGGNDKKDTEKNEKNKDNENEGNNLGKALRNKIVINDKILFFFFQAENMIDQTAEYVSKSYIEKIFFCLK